jgi:chemotaxis protein MotB
MRPKYLEPDHRSRDRWMVSYLDVMTILLIFFISVAVKAQKQAAPPVPASHPAAPAPAPASLVPVQTPATPGTPPVTDLERRLAARGLDVHREQRGVVVSLPQAILFGSGDDRISRSALPMVAKIADEIRDLPNPVMLVGYADAIPIANRRFRNNWELAAARGLRLCELLTREYGIVDSRLSVSSEGANQPKDSNDTPGGRASNRRVEIVIAGELASTGAGRDLL